MCPTCASLALHVSPAGSASSSARAIALRVLRRQTPPRSPGPTARAACEGAACRKRDRHAAETGAERRVGKRRRDDPFEQPAEIQPRAADDHGNRVLVPGSTRSPRPRRGRNRRACKERGGRRRRRASAEPVARSAGVGFAVAASNPRYTCSASQPTISPPRSFAATATASADFPVPVGPAMTRIGGGVAPLQLDLGALERRRRASSRGGVHGRLRDGRDSTRAPAPSDCRRRSSAPCRS